MPKLDLEAIEATNRTSYPPPFDADMAGRWYRRLGPVAGLSDFGVSHVVLEPGGISSQRHWHDELDEFLVVLSGEAVLLEDGGETLLRAGDCAAWAKARPDGHHLINRSDKDCVFLAVGGPERGDCRYSDVDLHWDSAARMYRHKDGAPY